MKVQQRLFLLWVLVLAGSCAQPTPPRTNVDTTYKEERLHLAQEPVEFPEVNPFDADEGLRKAFRAGFESGWKLVLALWMGNASETPEEYRSSETQARAWREGLESGQIAAYRRVRALAKERNAGNLR